MVFQTQDGGEGGDGSRRKYFVIFTPVFFPEEKKSRNKTFTPEGLDGDDDVGDVVVVVQPPLAGVHLALITSPSCASNFMWTLVGTVTPTATIASPS